MPHEPIAVTVVVSGQPALIEIDPSATVEQLVKFSLEKTGNRGQPSSEWELRSADGKLIEQTLTVKDAIIVRGSILYLSPRAGAGGAYGYFAR